MSKTLSKPLSNECPQYVSAAFLAKKLATTPRFILQLAEQGKIPSHRLSFKIIRFNVADVENALGLNLTKGAVAV